VLNYHLSTSRISSTFQPEDGDANDGIRRGEGRGEDSND
jgi:hypothetical protein